MAHAAEETPAGNSTTQLTDAEKGWIKAHPNIQLGAPTSFPPFVIEHSKGQYNQHQHCNPIKPIPSIGREESRVYIPTPKVPIVENAPSNGVIEQGEN